MRRFASAFCALLCLVPVASATLSRPQENPFRKNGGDPGSLLNRQARVPQETDGAQSGGPLSITDETEVLLNDQPCKYAEVPGEARIVNIEVAADRRTILKIHFRTGK